MANSEENVQQQKKTPTGMSVVNHSHVVDVAVVVEHKVRECSEDSLFWLDVDRRLPPRGASRE